MGARPLKNVVHGMLIMINKEGSCRRELKIATLHNYYT